MESLDEIRLDDGSEALPDQGGPKIVFRLEQLVPAPPSWMTPEQRAAFYLHDLAEIFGVEFLSDTLEGQAVLSQFAPRSSRKPEPPKRIPPPKGNDEQTELF